MASSSSAARRARVVRFKGPCDGLCVRACLLLAGLADELHTIGEVQPAQHRLHALGQHHHGQASSPSSTGPEPHNPAGLYGPVCLSTCRLLS